MKGFIVMFLLFMGLNSFVYMHLSSASSEYGERSQIGYLLLDKHMLIGDEDFQQADLNLDVNHFKKKYDNIYYLSYKTSQLPEGIKNGDKVKVSYSEISQTKIPQIAVKAMELYTSSCEKKSELVGHIYIEEKILIEDGNLHAKDIHLDMDELQAKYQIVLLHIESPLLLEGIVSGDQVAIGYSRMLESYPPIALVTCIEKLN
ncbi:hypothetical protein [Cytobacillus kochii]|uniref:hypothetical protein n=1 Tax=Cytobacillus kochii TaxID=859143 RepID=UPI0025A15E22|nr:hypothetical protein [Cytobacillus kochii]MDM5209067.1 hypothetical protein [Cytobacillus kochii]